jgi:PAS domain S-box-containing protein
MSNQDIKVLIVDDEPRNLDALEVMLEPSGCTLVRAQSADEALLAMLRDEFAAVILDIRMPGTNGFELVNLIKQRRRSQDVPILFLTAHLFEDEDVLRGYKLGAVDYLSKPVKAEILRSKVAVFIDLYRKTRALGVLNDALQTEIADRRQAQEALEVMNRELELRVADRTGARNNEDRLKMAVDVAQMAAWEWDVESGRMTWSADPEALFGFPAGSFGPDLRMRGVLHPDDSLRFEAAVKRAMRTGSTYECEYRAMKPDGGTVWITERGRTVHAEDGRLEKIVGVSRDISAQRQAQQEREDLLATVRRALDEAERQSRIKDEFVATVSHELRTPMNAILGWLSLLMKGDAVRDQQQALGVIQRNAQVQAKLIEDLLEMNKLASGTVRLELASVDVVAVVDAAVQAVGPTAIAKGVKLSFTGGGTVPWITADGRRLQQILWNLLHNAVKFTPAKGHVDIGIGTGADVVMISVKDTGQGIAPDFLPFVFDRFRQADPSATRGAWGLGIGLSIAKHLVELHGGSIEASSPGLGQGSIFVVSLPASAAIPQSDDVSDGAPRLAVALKDASCERGSGETLMGSAG